MGALSGLTVLDLSRVLAGPYCTQMLSDLGAIVWKVESPWGDDTRRYGPPFVHGESAYFLATNRGKKSLAINLRDSRGQDLVRRLTARADIFIENYKLGDLARYNLGYATLSKLNPRLVYASITGFGQTGPRAAEPGYDAALQGFIGLMSVTGFPDGPPTKVGVAWVDLITGLTATIGILAAIQERERSGQGQFIDLSLYETGLMAMISQGQSYLATGETPQRLGNAHPQIVPYETFRSSDGWFILGIGNDEQYRKGMQALGLNDLATDPELQGNTGRVARRKELVQRITAQVAGKPTVEWLGRLNAAGVPASAVNTIPEALNDPQAKARGAIWTVPHPKLGPIPLLANALQHMSRTPAEPASHPPLLGEHTEEILTQTLGLHHEEIERLVAAGVVLTKPS